MMLLLVTLILAHLFVRSWWSKTLLTLAVIPLSVAKNAVRIFTIAELTTRVDPSFIEGRLHRNGGVVFLTMAVVMVILLLWLLRKSELRALRDRSLMA
jgi:exosortase/archaeosortase family protein